MELIRRVDRRRHLPSGTTVTADAFRCRQDESALSFTLRNQSLATDESIDRYQKANALKSGDLPGLVVVTAMEIEQAGLQIRLDVDTDDLEFGSLHHVVDCPSEQQAELLAARASERGVLRDLVKKPRS